MLGIYDPELGFLPFIAGGQLEDVAMGLEGGPSGFMDVGGAATGLTESLPSFTAPTLSANAFNIGDFGATGGVAPEAAPGMMAPGTGVLAPPATAGGGATAGTAGGAAGGSTGGFGDLVKQYAGPVSQILGGGAMLAQIPLGLSALNVAKQGQQAQSGAIKTEQAAAAPALAAESTLLPAGTKAITTGELPPVMQANVDQQVNQVRQQMLQQLSNAGISPETANSMIAGQIEQLRQQLILQAGNALLSGGTSTAATAEFGGQAGGQMGGALFQTATGSLTSAQQSLQKLLGQA